LLDPHPPRAGLSTTDNTKACDGFPLAGPPPRPGKKGGFPPQAERGEGPGPGELGPDCHPAASPRRRRHATRGGHSPTRGAPANSRPRSPPRPAPPRITTPLRAPHVTLIDGSASPPLLPADLPLLPAALRSPRPPIGQLGALLPLRQKRVPAKG